MAITRDKDTGKLIVTTKTLGKSMMPTGNRKARRSFLNRKRYAMTQRKIKDLLPFVKSLTTVKPCKKGGKYVTGYYSYLLQEAKGCL